MNTTLLVLALFFLQTATTAFSAEVDSKQFVHGAGPSTRLVQLFFTEFAKLPAAQGYSFEIPPKSVKHAGGIKSSAKYLFGRTGRPLNEEERKMNKGEIILGQVPVAFVVGAETGVTSLGLGQLEKIMSGGSTNWKEVGGVDAPITTVGREEGEAVFMALKEKYPFFRSAQFSQTFAKDDDVVAFVQNVHGKHALAFGAVSNFEGKEGIVVLTIPGFALGLKLGLVYDLANQDKPLVKAVAEYAGSPEWSAIAVANGFFAPME